MISPEHERPQGTDDAYTAHVWDAGGERFVAVRVGARGNAEAVLVRAGADEQTTSATLETAAPLERWRLSAGGSDGTLEWELRALCAPVTTLHGQRYSQLCAVSGAFEGFGVRSHDWGAARAKQRRRMVSAAAPDGVFVTVAAARDAAGTPHGEELVSGQIVEPHAGGEPHPFEDVRLSTIYDAAGRPRKAGLELYRPGEELPTRASGEAVWSNAGIAFFRWTLAGHPAWGTYELEQHA